MLYERWLEVARSRGKDIALRELASGRDWSFSALAEEVEASTLMEGPVSFPRGQTAEFVLTVLRAWRAGRVVCPLERGQPEPSVPIPPANCVHLKTTSATAGRPRMVAFTEEQLAADSDNIVQTMGLRPDWPNVGLISLAHSYGFSNLVTPLLLHGIPLILGDSSLPESIRLAGRHAEALTVPAVPALWRAWHAAGTIPPSVKLAISAGAPLPLELERRVFEELGLKIHNFYGATECGGIAYDVTEAPRSAGEAVGAAVQNVVLNVGREGCLEVRGAAVGETYWPVAEEALVRGCFLSADLVDIEGGAVLLRGRIGDRINVAGRKVDPEVIEGMLREYRGVKECVVFGCPDDSHGRSESIVAIVETDASVSRERLRDFLLGRLPPWHVPRDWWFVDSLPADGRGKISRPAWREKYLTNRRR
ncbi:MAG TPA: class I adenylate-forming enzyme family protein [Verrucomicrobiae bacterium]|nr:class I adenylate-forming enzyme family protein [Verrucomicrobiae bacterium]